MAHLFHSFALASGLHLNLCKTVAVPIVPGPRLRSLLRDCLREACWDEVDIREWGKYLGFLLGPGVPRISSGPSPGPRLRGLPRSGPGLTLASLPRL